MAWHAFLPEGTIKVKVQRGYVTLTGTVDWHYQTVAAEAAVRKLTGVAGVTNLIALRSARPASATEVEHKIKAALERNADVERALDSRRRQRAYRQLCSEFVRSGVLPLAGLHYRYLLRVPPARNSVGDWSPPSFWYPGSHPLRCGRMLSLVSEPLAADKKNRKLVPRVKAILP
jgi:hypothetical protein